MIRRRLLMMTFLFITFLLNNNYTFAQQGRPDQEQVLTESLEVGVFTDQTFAVVPLPAFAPNPDGSSTYVIVTIKLPKQSVSIKAFAMAGDGLDSDEYIKEYLSTIAFYRSIPSEEQRQVNFLVFLPTDLSFVPTDLYLEFYSVKGEKLEKKSGQVLPAVLYQ